MGTEIEKNEPEKRRAVDVTKPWRRQFFECKEKGPTPAFNSEGFWRKPVHGILTREKK